MRRHAQLGRTGVGVGVRLSGPGSDLYGRAFVAADGPAAARLDAGSPIFRAFADNVVGLAPAALDAVEAEEHAARRYQCSPDHTGTPLWPVAQQFRLTWLVGYTNPLREGL